MRILCLAAHPDDETLGAGGTILRHRADGADALLLVATVAHAPRWSDEEIHAKRDECLAAAQILRFSDVRFLDWPTMHLASIPAIELCEAVQRVVRDWRPQLVYAPPFDDVNSDHNALFAAALVATRHVGPDSPGALYSYEIPSTTRFAAASRWYPNTYVDISAHLEQKLSAMARYRTELRDPPHPRSLDALRIFARERGAAMGMQYAEAHMLIRQTR